MNFSRCVLSSTVLAGAVFAVATLPLAMMGSQPVTIQLEREPVFVGQVKELAAPYLGFATAISLGVGVASLATAGWRHSARKYSQAEEQMSALKQQIQEQEMLLENLQFSTSRLSGSGLDFFLQDETAQPTQPAAPVNPPVQYTVVDTVQASHSGSLAQHVSQHVSQPVPAAPSLEAKQQNRVQAATALSSAQAFIGFARPTFAEVSAVARPTGTVHAAAVSQTAEGSDLASSAQMNELLNHLKHVMAQIEGLQVDQTAPQNFNAPASIWPQQKFAS